MAWVKVTDTFNSAPEWMAAAELAADKGDQRLVTELKGITIALFTQSAVAWTDYWISYGAVIEVVGIARVDEVIADLVAIGVLFDRSTPEQRQYRLLEKDSFIHLIKADQKKRDAKRKRDRRKKTLMVPVLLRDGSECRYCGDLVNWNDNKHDQGGTFDHRDFEAETTADNFVVSCRGCNRLRADFEDPDKELPLLDPPEIPTYDAPLLAMLGTWPDWVARWCRDQMIPNPLIQGAVELKDRGAGGSEVESVKGRVREPELSARAAEIDPRNRSAHPVQNDGTANAQRFPDRDSRTTPTPKQRKRRRRR